MTRAMFVQQHLFIIEDWKETEIWNDWQTWRPKTILFSFIFKADELGRQAVLYVFNVKALTHEREVIFFFYRKSFTDIS